MYAQLVHVKHDDTPTKRKKTHTKSNCQPSCAVQFSILFCATHGILQFLHSFLHFSINGCTIKEREYCFSLSRLNQTTITNWIMFTHSHALFFLPFRFANRKEKKCNNYNCIISIYNSMQRCAHHGASIFQWNIFNASSIGIWICFFLLEIVFSLSFSTSLSECLVDFIYVCIPDRTSDNVTCTD